MSVPAIAFAVIAAVVHVGFFVIESFLFTKPPGRKIFGTSAADAETMKFLAYNQGFYNLFLAGGCLAGVGLAIAGRDEAGRALVLFTCTAMIGAAAVLATGGARYLRGVVMQGAAPAIAVSLLLAA